MPLRWVAAPVCLSEVPLQQTEWTALTDPCRKGKVGGGGGGEVGNHVRECNDSCIHDGGIVWRMLDDSIALFSKL